VQHVLAVLEPLSTAQGGVLEVEVLEYKAGRPNIKITYPGASSGARTIGFVGSHLDVVPANPETWERDPFSLTVEGDKLYGRGTTDCLGHVALMTLFFAALGEQRPALDSSVVCLLIAGEEGGESGVGVDRVVEANKIDCLKNGPVFWIDSADSQPCVGTAGAMQWHLKATGRLFHSGLPHRGINSLELVSEAMAEIQKRFYSDFPQHPREIPYNFSTSSTMKPTQIECAKGALNQLPPWTTISGDIRLTPFYDAGVVMETIEGYVKDLNDNIESLPTRGAWSKYTLEGDDIDVKRGKLELTWSGTLEDVRHMEGIACDLDSPGLVALTKAIADVKGKGEPYAICGSLPLVREMQAAGFDVQISGFGLSSVYHADNEYCLLSDMVDAFKVFVRVVSLLEADGGDRTVGGSNGAAEGTGGAGESKVETEAPVVAAPADPVAAAVPAVAAAAADAASGGGATALVPDGMSPADVFELIVSKKSGLRWMVLELTNNGKALECTAQGSDYTSFTAQFDAAKVMWGAFNVHGVDERNSVESVRTKVVQINWVGASVPPMKRMKAMQGGGLVSEIIAGAVAVSIDANTTEDIEVKDIATKLADCGGAHKPSYYEFGAGVKLTLADIGKDVAGDDF
jgi:acetylornithine deacetylase